MKRLGSVLTLASVLFAFGAIRPPDAHAVTVTVFGGSYFASGERGLYGAELGFSLAPGTTLGAFYQYSHRISNTDTNNVTIPEQKRNFYGLVGRYITPIIPVMADIRLAYHHTNVDEDPNATGPYTREGWYGEVGLGYSISVIPAVLDIQPRFGFVVGESNLDIPWANASLMLSLSF